MAGFDFEAALGQRQNTTTDSAEVAPKSEPLLDKPLATFDMDAALNPLASRKLTSPPVPQFSHSPAPATTNKAAQDIINVVNLASDIDANELAIKRIIKNRYGDVANGYVVDELTKPQLEKLIQVGSIKKDLERDTLTKQMLAKDPELALMLSGEMPPLLSAEEHMKSLALAKKITEDPKRYFEEVEVKLASEGTNVAQGLVNSIARSGTSAWSALLQNQYTDQALTARAAGTDWWTAFKDQFKLSFGRKVLSYSPPPLAFIEAIGEGVGRVSAVEAAGGFSEATATKEMKQAYEGFKEAYEFMQRMERKFPMAESSRAWFEKFDQLPDRWSFDNGKAFIELVMDDWWAFAKVSTQILAEQVPVLTTAAVATRFFGPRVGKDVYTLGSYGREKLSLDNTLMDQLKLKYDIDLNTDAGIKKLLATPDAIAYMDAFRTRRGLAIGVADRATLGLMSKLPLKSFTLKSVVSAPIELAGEGAGEGFAQFSTTGTASLKDVALESVAGVIKTPIDVLIAGGSDVIDTQQKRAAQQKAEQLKALREELQKISAEKREAAAEMFGQQLSDNGVYEVYIDAGQLLSYDQDGNVSDALGLDFADVQRSALEGGRVAVNTEAFVRQIVGDEGFSQLIDHITDTEGGLTAAEAKQYVEEDIEGKISLSLENRAAARLKPRISDTDLKKLETDIGTILETVAAQLQSTGVYDAERSQVMALLTAQRYATRAVRLTEETGRPVDALNLYLQDNLQITGRAEVRPQVTFEQAQKGFVDERIPQLEEAARQRSAGEITQEQYQAVVDEFKPVLPYESVPEPATVEEMRGALQDRQLHRLGKGKQFIGQEVGIRLDIPAYSNHGVWVPTVHINAPPVAHEAATQITNAVFTQPGASEVEKAARVGRGEVTKTPFARIDGILQSVDPVELKALADQAINDPAWTQVGYDPRRHTFFYDRKTQRPVLAADEVIQVGPLVLAKNAQFGEAEAFLYQDSLLQEDGDHPLRIATRQPTQPTGEDKPTIGLDTIRDDAVYMAKMRSAIDSYPNFRPDENETDAESVERYIEEVKGNLLWLHDTYGDDYRDRGSQWYDGARRITEAWMQRYGIEDNQVAGVLAALSPQMDWFTNVSLGERVIDTFLYGQDISWDTDMQSTMDRIFPEILTDKNGNPVLDKKGNVKGYAALRAQIEGKTLAELADGTPAGDGLQAAWIRVYDETNNSRWYTGITPEGGLTASPTNADGSKKARRWGGLRDIAKAVSILRDPSPANISASLGTQHKVRNFYNNILAPNNPHGDVTIDTHAVAAAQLRPLGGSALAVAQNLSGPPKSAPLGAVGTYAIHAEAYRRAAGERGILARQMQSITWEAVRTLFTDTFKTKANIDKIDAVWQEYTDGKITDDEARNQIEAIAGGVGAPFWADIRPDSTNDAASGNATYEGKLSVAERGAKAIRPGRAGDLGRPELEQQALDAGPRGGFTPADRITDQDGNPVNLIQIFEKADVSTFLHESGHFWLEQLKGDAAAVGGQFGRDWDIVRNWWGSRPLELREEAVRRAKKAKDKDAVAALQKMTEAQVAAYARAGDLRGEGTMRYLSVAMHEQFARGVENYFATGRAPSLSLAGAFNAFKVWVLSVYTKLFGARLDVQFSPEVTQVMDRMLAADEEISMIETQYELAALFDNAAQAGLTPSQFADYQQQLAEAKSDRRAQQVAKHIKELKRARTKWWNAEREKMRAEVTAEIADQTVYRLVAELTSEGAERIDRDALQEVSSIKIATLPRIKGRAIYQEDGISPALVAAQYGYGDVNEMLQELDDYLPLNDVVEGLLDRRMEEEHGSIETSQEIEALHSAYSDKTARILASELEALRTTEPAFKQQFLRAYARNKILGIPAGELRPYKFLMNERRHAKLAARALKSGDRVQAYQHQFQRLANHYMAREAINAQRDIETKYRYLRKFIKPGQKFKSIDADYVDNILRILASVNMEVGPDRRRGRQLEILELQKFIEQRQEADGSILDIPAWLTDPNEEHNIKKMPYMRFLQLHEVIKRYETQGRDAKKIIVGNEQADRAQTKAELLAILDARKVALVNRLRSKTVSAEDANKFYKAVAWVAETDTSLLKMEALLEAIDGKPLGVWHQTLYEPFNQAENAAYILREEVSKLIGKLLADLPKEVRRGFGKSVDVGDLGRPGMSFTRGNLIMLALNVGNASNLDKLIRGMGGDPDMKIKGAGWNINEQLIDEALKKLTKEEWALIEAVWRHAEKLYPEVERIYRQENGISPDRVEPRIVSTPYGDIQGGYFPMMYDRSQPGDAAAQQDRDALQEFQVAINRAAVNSSMTKGRTAYAAPVDLSITRLTHGLDNTIHFITHFEAVRNANKILNDKDIRSEFELKVGIAYVQELRAWVAALATNNSNTSPVKGFEQALEYLLNGTTLTMLGFSYSTLALQTVGLTNGLDMLAADTSYGPVSLAQIQKELVKGLLLSVRPEHRAFVQELSVMMRARRQNMDRDVGRILRDLTGKTGTWANIQRFSMTALAEVQYTMVDLPVWTAAYNRALRANPDDTAAALKYADRVVRVTQSSGTLKDLAEVQRRRGWAKFATMFYSFFSALYAVLRNMGVQFPAEVRKNPASAITKAASRAFVLLAVSSLATGAIRGELPDVEPEDEEATNLLEYVAIESLNTALGVFPLIRDVATGTLNGTGYKGGAGTAALEMIGKTSTVLSEFVASFDEDAEGFFDGTYEQILNKLKPVILSIAILTKTAGGVQATRTLDGLAAYFDDAENWEPQDLARGYNLERALARD